MKTRIFTMTTLALIMMLNLQAQWLTNGNSIYYNSGMVSIGTEWISPTWTALNIGSGMNTWGSQIILSSDSLAGGLSYQITSTGGDAREGSGKFLIRGNGYRALLVLDSVGYFGIGTKAPSARLQVADGDVYIDNINNGIIMKSPNGQCWRGKLDNSGNLGFKQIECPVPDTTQITNVSKKVKVSKNIVVYPNPSDNNITIVIENYKDELLTAIITNSSGRIIDKKLINTDVTTMNTSNMIKGIYILSIEDKRGNVILSSKIIRE
jgi:hypothetical protein